MKNPTIKTVNEDWEDLKKIEAEKEKITKDFHVQLYDDKMNSDQID